MEGTRRKFAWKRWVILFVVLLLLGRLELPYYYSQPGIAQTLEGMIDVEQGYKDDTGTFMLTTIRSARATPILAFWSLFSDFRSLYPAPADISDEEYDERQRMLMNNSQENAKIAAYKAANTEVNIEYKGVYVTGIVDGMAAEGVIKAGDLIRQVDAEDVYTAEDLLQKLEGFSEGDEVDLTIERAGEISIETVAFTEFPEDANAEAGRVGIGIVGPVTNRIAEFDPEVTISAGAIGGPSAGLMFSLEIYSQLLEVDLTKGYAIAGTGTIDDEGNVGPIGGANQKVVAANQEGAEFFLVPNQNGAPNSNYKEAKKAAESINTDMQIIPIDTLEEALEFLMDLPEK